MVEAETAPSGEAEKALNRKVSARVTEMAEQQNRYEHMPDRVYRDIDVSSAEIRRFLRAQGKASEAMIARENHDADVKEKNARTSG